MERGKKRSRAQRYQKMTPYKKNHSGYPKGLNQELKFHDIDVDDAVIAVGGTIQAELLVIPEGIGEEQRIGRKIVIKKIGFRFSMKIGTGVSGAATADIVRVILYQDKQANGAVAVASGNPGILEANDFQSFNNLSNTGRFRILMDRTYTIQCTAGSGRGSTDTLDYGEALVQDSFFKDVNIPVEYDNSVTTGAIESMRSNNIGLLLLSREGSVEFDSKLRFRYLD